MKVYIYIVGNDVVDVVVVPNSKYKSKYLERFPRVDKNLKIKNEGIFLILSTKIAIPHHVYAVLVDPLALPQAKYESEEKVPMVPGPGTNSNNGSAKRLIIVNT